MHQRYDRARGADRPARGQCDLLQSLDIWLGFTAQDAGTGLAKVQAAFLGAGGSWLSAFYTCGGGSGLSCSPPNAVSEYFLTQLAAGTKSIRVQAWDFAGLSGQATTQMNYIPPPATLNLWAMGMEITQVTQPWVATSNTPQDTDPPRLIMPASAAPLVRDKMTAVRVYPGIEGAPNYPLVGAKATLFCYQSNMAPCPGVASVSWAKPITVSQSNGNNLNTLRADPSLAWNFVLPTAWTNVAGSIILKATVDTPAGINECAGCYDGANSLIVNTVQFRKTSPLKLTLVWACVRREASDPTTRCDTVPTYVASDVFDNILNGFVQTYPLAHSDIQISLHSPQTVPFDGEFLAGGAMTSNRMDAFLGYISGLIESDTGKKRADLPINQVYFGIVPPPVTDILGLALRNCAVGKLDAGNILTDTLGIAAHEVGHTLGRPHAGCNVHEDNPEGPPCDPIPAVFPCAHGGICTYGFDAYQFKVIPPGDPNGQHANDLMSYGPMPLWISPYTYGKLFEALKNAPATAMDIMLSETTGQGPSHSQDSEASRTPDGDPSLDARRGLPGPADPLRVTGGSLPDEPVLWISGVVSSADPPDFAAELAPFYQLIGPAASRGEGTGAYRLELLDAAGGLLFARNFEPQVTHGNPPDPEVPPKGRFFEVVPFSEELARVVLKQDDEVLAERDRTPSRPEVMLLAPRPGEFWDDGLLEIAWEAADADDDPLVYLVQYSADDGATWSTLVRDWTKPVLPVDAAGLAGSARVRVRVLASDGMNTAAALSGRFIVADKPPLAWIAAPRSRGDAPLAFEEGDVVVFESNAADREQAQLDNTAFTWRSDRDGPLGTGRRLDVTTLTPGTHVVTLSVADRGGRAGEATVTVIIRERPNTQPVADAGPELITFGQCAPVLDGRASRDPDGDRLVFLWSIVGQPAGSRAWLGDPEGPTTHFFSDQPGEYAVELTVHDGQVASVPDRVTMRVTGAGANRVCTYLPVILRAG